MFKNAIYFNSDSVRWFDIPNVKFLDNVFAYASNFSRNLCNWGPQFKPNIQHPRDYNNMFAGTNCSSKAEQIFYPGGVTPLCSVRSIAVFASTQYFTLSDQIYLVLFVDLQDIHLQML